MVVINVDNIGDRKGIQHGKILHQQSQTVIGRPMEDIAIASPLRFLIAIFHVNLG